MLKNLIYKENKMLNYFETLRNIFLDGREILFFGAGRGGAVTCQWILNNVPNVQNRIVGFLDNNPRKWNTKMLGYPVKKPTSEFLNKERWIVISCGEGDVIINQLKNMGLRDESNILIPDLSILDSSGNDFGYIWENIDAFESVYELLEDEKSKQVFCNILNFKICHDFKLIEKICDPCNQQYFDTKLITFSESDIFVDCGAYVGDTLDYYKSRNTDKFKKYYAIEADNDNYDKLFNKYKNDNRIIPINLAIWNRKEKLRFDNLGSGSGNISKNGSIIVEAESLDKILNNGKVTFIKMDIEGAEYNALLGGVQIIEKWHPTLMISVYHKRDDFIRLPLLIKSIYPGYRLYFRHYRKLSVQETVCYAIDGI